MTNLRIGVEKHPVGVLYGAQSECGNRERLRNLKANFES